MARDRQRDEQAPLLAKSSTKKSSKPPSSLLDDEIDSWTRFLNPKFGRSPWRLFEWCDLSFFPEFLTNKAQAVLTAQWRTRLPILQSKPPAARAAKILRELLDEVERIDSSPVSVVDLCAGSGGPIPVIEKFVNAQRKESNKSAVPFIMADLHPNLDAWIDVSSKSANVSFLPNPVDATKPPPSAVSKSTPESIVARHQDPSSTAESTARTRIIRLYNLSFHHFDDSAAVPMLSSTLQTADGFGIIELQDRRISSLIMMIMDIPLVFAGSLFWFYNDPVQLFFTYIVPVMPFLMSFDGFVSSLRTREFEEVMGLVDKAMTNLGKELDGEGWGTIRRWRDEDGRRFVEVRRGGWIFRGVRECHTWPIGFVNAVVGWKAES